MLITELQTIMSDQNRRFSLEEVQQLMQDLQANLNCVSAENPKSQKYYAGAQDMLTVCSEVIKRIKVD